MYHKFAVNGDPNAAVSLQRAKWEFALAVRNPPQNVPIQHGTPYLHNLSTLQPQHHPHPHRLLKRWHRSTREPEMQHKTVLGGTQICSTAAPQVFSARGTRCAPNWSFAARARGTPGRPQTHPCQWALGWWRYSRVDEPVWAWIAFLCAFFVLFRSSVFIVIVKDTHRNHQPRRAKTYMCTQTTCSRDCSFVQ